MTKRKFEKLKNKWIKSEELAKAETKYDSKKGKRYWKKWSKYGKKLFKEENRVWRKKFNKEILDTPMPYNGGSWFLDAMFLLVERCFDYWEHGYNVYTAPSTYKTKIMDSVSKAMLLVEELKDRDCYNNKTDCFPTKSDKELIETLFKTLTEDMYDWYD